jgi:hypothetical protein
VFFRENTLDLLRSCPEFCLEVSLPDGLLK